MENNSIVNLGRKKVKGQFGMFEYLLLTVILLAVIIMIAFFLFGFQFGKQKAAQSGEVFDTVSSKLSYVASSDVFVNDYLLFDDSKLTVLLGSESCKDAKSLVGQDVCINVDKSLFIGEDKIECTPANYPNCNSWTICRETCDKIKQSKVALTVPINIYKKLERKTELGKVTVAIQR